MARQALPMHSLGWTKSAAEAVKAARKKHSENRRKEIKRILKGQLREIRYAALDEMKHPLNWINPIKLFVIWPIRSVGTVVAFLTETSVKLFDARKKSLTMKKAALTNVGYAIIEEMQRDEVYKKKITDLVGKKNDDKPKWIFVDHSGRVILSDNSRMSKANLEHPLKVFNAPKLNLEELVRRANLNFIEVEGTVEPTKIALRGNEIQVSITKPAKGSTSTLFETLRLNEMKDVKKASLGIPGKILLQFFMKSGKVRDFIVAQKEGDEIYKQMTA